MTYKKSEYQWATDYILEYSPQINTIAEIGSRDGVDTIFLSELFQTKNNYIFEADPNLIDGINKNLKNHNYKSNYEVFNIALGNENKEVDFLSVDKEKYNNLGVGSLFEINFHNREKSDPDFNRESVQKKVQVELKKYSSLKLETPDLIAMDVQGAELDVLKGFENLLKKVKFIISESSISENYIGGSTFLEMHKYLKNNFKLFINSRYGKNNFKLNVDAYKYKLSEKKMYQPDFNVLYINKNLV
tara:strand:- start:3062 stop:3796 length:735 start_codon:yes stop_codon:yes gene_type:complete